MWAIVRRYPKSVLALAAATGVSLPEYDQVLAAPDAHPVREGDPIHTDATVRLLRKGVPVYFATVEMQRNYEKGKYATLHAYHGSGVRNIDAGGHLFLLSDKVNTVDRFRTEDMARRADLAFSTSFSSAKDLKSLEDAVLPLDARALPAALADLGADPPRTRAMLGELDRSDPTLADLYLRTMMEEVPVATLGDIVLPDMFDKLRHLDGFREYEAKVKAEGKAETEAATTAGNLTKFLILRGDKPTAHALATISSSHDAVVLSSWLTRAYLGETAAELFPEPKSPAS